jgi:hypothetical protein
VQYNDGSWHALGVPLGVPVGRPQPIALDLTGLLPAGAHELRIRTNMRIYWDEIQVGERVSDADVRVTRIDPRSAELRWRGYSAEVSPDGREPYGYDFARVSALSPWKVMPGRYTREGDVLPLVTRADDMFVISRPGDDIALTFDAGAVGALPHAMRRSYLFYADGFSKEMDLNSASPDVVEPLPFHGMSTYPYPASEHYPQTAAHAEYLQTYNTRVVAQPIEPIEIVAAKARAESRPAD